MRLESCSKERYDGWCTIVPMFFALYLFHTRGVREQMAQRMAAEAVEAGWVVREAVVASFDVVARRVAQVQREPLEFSARVVARRLVVERGEDRFVAHLFVHVASFVLCTMHFELCL